MNPLVVMKIESNAINYLSRSELIKHIVKNQDRYPYYSNISRICRNCGFYVKDKNIDLGNFEYVDHCNMCDMSIEVVYEVRQCSNLTDGFGPMISKALFKTVNEAEAYVSTLPGIMGGRQGIEVRPRYLFKDFSEFLEIEEKDN